MRVALIQVGYGDDEPLEARVRRVVDLVREQRGHDLVVLPELWPHGGFAYEAWRSTAQPANGAVAQAISSVAAEIGATVHGGSIVERPGVRGPEGKELWNTSLLFGPDGEQRATYRKIHRFGFGVGEPRLMEAGEDLVVLDLPDGHGGTVRAGLSTCYDLRFPELYRAQVDAGAEVFVVPAAWPMVRLPAWRLLAQARAVEDLAYVLACNTAGTHAGSQMGGHSMVVDPRGRILAEAGEEQEVLSVEIDPALVREHRSEFPALTDRRWGR